VSLLLSSSLKMITRDYQAVFWALAFPIIFLGVFRLFSFEAAGTADLIVSAAPDSPRGQALMLALADVEFLDVTMQPGLDEPEARAILEDRDAHVVLLVPDAPLDDTAEALMLHRLRDPIGSAMTLAAIESVVAEVNLALSGAPRPIDVTVQSLDVRETTFFQFVGPGIIGMGLMLFATINLAGSLSRYREEGVLRRIRATPLPPWRFFSSVVGAHLVVTLVQIVVLVAVAEILGAQVLRGGLALVFIALFGTLIFLNIGVIVAGRVQSRGGVEGAANAITLPMMFLSGTFFPISSLPDAIQPLVELLPLTHMLRAMRGVTLDGESFFAQGPELLVMAAWVAVTFVAARFAFSFRDA
jgi:ABC-2 type transport system permease protein